MVNLWNKFLSSLPLVSFLFMLTTPIFLCETNGTTGMKSTSFQSLLHHHPIFEKLTSEQIQEILSPLGMKNTIGGTVVGQLCNHTQWKQTLGSFISTTTNQYPLERNQDWLHLISILVNHKPNSESWRYNSSSINLTAIGQLILSSSHLLCFTGGPFTLCSQSNRCTCDENNYVQGDDDGTCYGKLHSNCGLGVQCVPGLHCVFQNSWNLNNETIFIYNSSNNMLELSKILGYCGGKDDTYFELRRRKWPYKRFEFFMQGLVVSTVSVFGILGNFLSILVLTKPQLGSSTSYVLMAMTTSDIIYLVGQFLDTGIELSTSYFTVTKNDYVYMADFLGGTSYSYSLMRKCSYFFYELGNVGSIYFTVLVSLERYIVICHALKAKRFCSKKNAFHASLGVLVFSVIFNLPKVFATEILKQEYHPNATFSGGRHRNSPLDWSIPNMTIPIYGLSEKQNEAKYYITTTTFGYSKEYNWYLQWSKIIFKYFIPYYWLMFFNFWIILELKRSDKIREQLTHHKGQQHQYGQKRKLSRSASTSTTRMMLCVVCVFGICYLPLFIHEIFFRIPNYEPFQNNYDLMYKSITSSIIYNFVKLFATLNSSVNFIIYCVLGEKFRMSLKLMLSSWANSLQRGRCKG